MKFQQAAHITDGTSITQGSTTGSAAYVVDAADQVLSHYFVQEKASNCFWRELGGFRWNLFTRLLLNFAQKKSHVVLLTVLADSSFLSAKYRPCRHFHFQ